MGCYVKNDWSNVRKNKYMFLEQGMRGGVSYIHKRYGEASKNVNMLYLDMNNLYGCAMRQYLPINKIEQKLMRIKNNSSTGFVLEVDLEYMQELDDIHNDYSLAPEKLTYQKNGYLIIA